MHCVKGFILLAFLAGDSILADDEFLRCFPELL